MTLDLDHQKDRGAFYTPLEISRFLVEWAVRSPLDRVLEPSCGDAGFLIPAASRLTALGATAERVSAALTGVEIHKSSALEAKARLHAAGFSTDVINADFFDQEPQPCFDAVVGNPPYIRYQNFGGLTRAKGLKAALAQGVRLTSLASSWAAFTIHASCFLKAEGRLGLVLPAELLSVNYASEVRRFLLSRFAKVRLIAFEKLLFPGVLEEVVLLLAEGRGTASHFEFYQARDVESLASLNISSWRGYVPTADEKWTPALIHPSALEIYRGLTERRDFATLAEWGDTYLGSVTGNNNFFTLSVSDAARLRLDAGELKKISPPGSRHLRDLTFSAGAWTKLAAEGARCYLFAPREEPSRAAQAYIALGERTGVHKAYKCKVRSPWWRVPLVAKPDLLFTYMSHDRPRLTRNSAGALILNSLYGVKLRRNLKKIGRANLPIAYLNTVTLLGSEIVGRAYGGGLLKHEPREADLLPVPSRSTLQAAHDELQLLKPQLATALSQNCLSKAVEMVDQIILEKHLKLPLTEIAHLRDAREFLFNRRLARGKR
jgi:adenine-specific DNA-methyltransferase